MKKLFAVIMAVAMLTSTLVFTANAADNEWEVYASVNKYKAEEEYEEDNDRPKIPGLRYTDNGVQAYSATHDELDAMGTNAWLGLQLKEKVKLTDGFSMTALVDTFTEDAQADKWIAFGIWTEPKCTPGDTEHGQGWFCLIRPTATNITIQSFIDTPTNLKAAPALNQSIYNGDALVLDVKKEDGKLNIYVNDQDMQASGVFSKFENDEAYISIVGHQGNRDEMAITVTDVNGTKPTGTDAQAPFVSAEAQPKVEGPVPEENNPCWIWTAADVKKGQPGTAMTSTVNDDGSLHITFDDTNAPQIIESIKKYLYKAEDYPVWAIKFKNLDEIGDALGTLWFCAGDVFSAQNDSQAVVSWADCDYEEEDGWKLLTVDLSDEPTWDGNINSFRLDIAGGTALAGEEADIAWIGFFRSEKEAFYYAEMGEYYEREFGTTTTPTTTEEAPADDTTTEATDDTTAATDDTAATDVATDTAATTTDGGKTETKSNNTAVIIIIIVACVVVIAVVVCVIVLSKKKKK